MMLTFLHLDAKVMILDENGENSTEIFSFFIKNFNECWLSAFFFITLQ